jgi:hypothetical protein
LKGALVVGWSLVFGLWSLVFGLWSLVFGLWSLVFGLWSLVFGFWFLVFGFCALCFVLCGSLSTFAVLLDKNKTAASFRWQRVIRKSLLRAFELSAQEHDPQPATSMVVMPMSIVAVICSKHRLGFIPDEPATCQILSSSALIHTVA